MIEPLSFPIGGDAGAPREIAPDAGPEAIKSALRELVRLKEVKDRSGETADYRAGKDRAWEEARRVLGLG